jgi:hypothetical protein
MDTSDSGSSYGHLILVSSFNPMCAQSNFEFEISMQCVFVQKSVLFEFERLSQITQNHT